MPQRLTPISLDGSELTIEALRQIAPSCITEVKDPQSGATRQVVDFDVLRTLLGDQTVEAGTEMYSFIWPGKQAARREAATPITDTLRPVLEDSVDWDTTENLYIEGDNLSVLKLLQRSYVGKVKMIYIDPPYNTGNDFIYNDDYTTDRDTWALQSGERDEEGNQYRKNSDTNGRFHSDWCSMIYSRLLLSRSLLTDDGVIFISIDDNEVHNLRKICDEVFGEKNFVAQIVWEQGRKSMAAQIAINHEYCLVYCKSKSIRLAFDSKNNCWRRRKEGLDEIYAEYNRLRGIYGSDVAKIESGMKEFYANLPQGHPSKAHKHYFRVDSSGIYYPGDISQGTGKGGRFDILHPVTHKPCKVPAGGWRFSKERLPEYLAQNKIAFGEDHNTVPCLKRYLNETEYEVMSSVFYKDGRGASSRLNNLLGGKYFDYPKDEDVIRSFVSLVCPKDDPDSIVLDFFSGSGTTAHAVMQLNAEDGGHRKFICVQLAEETPEDSEARKAGYKTIPDIAKERIRRAATKIKEENLLTTNSLDTGFRVFRLDSSNFTDVKRTPAELGQGELDLMLDNVKTDRSGQDLLYGAMLSWGLSLSLPQAVTVVDGCEIYNVDEGGLVACFAKAIPTTVIEAIADMDPLRVLLRDSSFASDKEKINTFERLKQRLNWDDKEALDKVRVI